MVAEIEAASGVAASYKVDVSKGDEVSALIDWTVERFGTLNGIFNNAGYKRFNACFILHKVIFVYI